MNTRIVLRLSGRPELERTAWLVTPKIKEVGWFRAITAQGSAKFVATGHTEDDCEVWVPEDRTDDWPPHHQRLINILTDDPEEEPNP